MYERARAIGGVGRRFRLPETNRYDKKRRNAKPELVSNPPPSSRFSQFPAVDGIVRGAGSGAGAACGAGAGSGAGAASGAGGGGGGAATATSVLSSTFCSTFCSDCSLVFCATVGAG